MKHTPALLLAVTLLIGGCSGEREGDDDGGVVVAADGQQLSRSTSSLVRAFDKDEDGSRGRLIEALARVAEKPDVDAVPFLLTLTGHADEEVRFSVVLALRAVGGDQAVAALAVMAAEDESELVRLEAGEG